MARTMLGVAAWVGALLALYDLTLLDTEALASPGRWTTIAGSSLLAFPIYTGALMICLLPVCLLHRLVRARRDGRGGFPPAPALLGVASGSAAVAHLVALLSQRSAAAGILTASWLADAQAVFLLSVAIGVAAAMALARWQKSSRSRRWLVALALLPALPPVLLTGAALASHPPGAAPRRAAAHASAQNILLVVVTSLRSDAAAFGEAGTLRAALLDEPGPRRVLLAEATAHSSETASATEAILTGSLPPSIPVGDTPAFGSHRAVSLAEALRSGGYRTSAFVADPEITALRGFARGFDHWDAAPSHAVPALCAHTLFARLLPAAGWKPPDPSPPRAAEMVDRLLAHLEAAPEGPWFAYLHLADPAAPYSPPADLTPRSAGSAAPSRAVAPGALRSILLGEIPMTESDLAGIRALYAAEVASVDRELRRLLGALAPGLADGSTAIVVTGAHGEEFFEHGWMGHGHGLHRELLQVPLILAGAGSEPSALESGAPVAHVDIAPTILDLAGLAPSPEHEGASLLAPPEGDGPISADRVILSWAHPVGPGFRTSDHLTLSARRGTTKLVIEASDVFRTGPWQRRVFDLAADPGEQEPLGPEAADLRALEAALAERVASLDRHTDHAALRLPHPPRPGRLP